MIYKTETGRFSFYNALKINYEYQTFETKNT